MGHKCGLLSTVCNYVDGEPHHTDHTTPDPIELNALLAEMVEAGCEYAFMECSSHAIAQKRIGGLTFAGGIFTNLTRDHLDYHKTFENYRNAKKKFFDDLPKGAFAITNADDKNGMVMTQNTKATVKTYSVRTLADFHAKIIECHFEGMYLEVNGQEVGVQFIGKFNVSNLLAVYGAAVMLGKNPEDVLVVLSTLKSVAGRLEPIRSANGVTALVDYAHTPDAIENVLNAIHEVMEGKSGKIITVCGAGGNRDKGKRPLMAQEAVKQSDRVIITSDNPRFEEPQDIINDMLAGLDKQQMKKVVSITDRHEAGQYNDVNILIGTNSDEGSLFAFPMPVEAFQKRVKDIYLVGVDALAEAVQDVLDGNMTGTVLNDDVGQATKAAEATKLFVDGKDVEKYYWVDYVKVTKDNASQYLK